MDERVLTEWLATLWVDYGYQCKRFGRERSAEDFLDGLIRKRHGIL